MYLPRALPLCSPHFAVWVGESGKRYDFAVSRTGVVRLDEPAVYIFARQEGGRTVPLFVGETASLLWCFGSYQELGPDDWQGAMALGMTHVHVRFEATSESMRREEAGDLIAALRPPLNAPATVAGAAASEPSRLAVASGVFDDATQADAPPVSERRLLAADDGGAVRVPYRGRLSPSRPGVEIGEMGTPHWLDEPYRPAWQTRADPAREMEPDDTNARPAIAAIGDKPTAVPPGAIGDPIEAPIAVVEPIARPERMPHTAVEPRPSLLKRLLALVIGETEPQPRKAAATQPQSPAAMQQRSTAPEPSVTPPAITPALPENKPAPVAAAAEVEPERDVRRTRPVRAEAVQAGAAERPVSPIADTPTRPEPTPVAPLAATRERPHAPQAPMVLFAGDVGWNGGADILFEAMLIVCAGHPDVRFVFAGDGALRSELQERAARSGLGDRCRFLGDVPADHFREVMAACAFVAIPARTPQGDDLARLALACGKPVLATHQSAVGCVAHGRNGLITYDNPGSFVWGVRELLGPLYGDLRRRLAEAA